MSLFSNKVFIGLVLSFVIAGLGGITGIVQPTTAVWIGGIVNLLTLIGHSTNVLKGV